MYSIAEEDSFLPALLTSNPAKQLAQVREYHERQIQRQLYLAQDIEDIRMAYCLKLCKEKERLSKSLWELHNQKRRILHQISNGGATIGFAASSRGNSSRFEAGKKERRARRREQKREKKKSDKEIRLDFAKTPASRLQTAKTPGSRLQTAASEVNETRRKTKWKAKQAKPDVPRYLFY